MAEILSSTEVKRKGRVNLTLFKGGPIGKSTCLAAALILAVTAAVFTVTTIITNAAYQPPKLNPDYFKANKNTPILMHVLYNDSGKDANDNLTIIDQGKSADFIPLWMATLTLRTEYKINGIVQRFYYAPVASQWSGVITFEYWVRNIKGAVRSSIVTITIVNRPPECFNDPHHDPDQIPYAYDLAKNTVDQALDVLLNDRDDDGDPLKVIACDFSGTAASFLLSCAPSPDGTKLWVTPFFGIITLANFEFRYTVSDGNATCSAIVRARVLNDPPIARSNYYTMTTNTLALLGNETDTGPLENDEDPNGDSLEITSVAFAPITEGQTAKGDLVAFKDADDNNRWKFHYYPHPIYLASPAVDPAWDDTWIYVVSDGTEEASATVYIRFIEKPPVTEDDEVTIKKHAPITEIFPMSNTQQKPSTKWRPRPYAIYQVSVTGVVFGSLDVTSVADTPNQEPLFWPIDTPLMTSVPVWKDTFRFTPRGVGEGPNEGYETSFTYTLTDGVESSSSIFTIKITNDAPIATFKPFECPKKTTCVGWDLMSGNSDPNLDTMTIISIDSSTVGTLTYDSFGIATFVAGDNEGFNQLKYTIVDDDITNPLTDFNFIAITVTNQPPTPLNDFYTANKNEKADPAFNVLANDDDPNGDVIWVDSCGMQAGYELTGSVMVVPFGIDNCANQQKCVSFTPAPQFDGTTVATYTVSDGFLTTTAIITITVTNQPPVAVDDTTQCQRNQKVIIDVLANDFDPNGDALSISDYSQPSLGRVTANADNKIEFEADNYGVNGGRGSIATQTFTYTAIDASFLTATATVTVTIYNTAPTTSPDSYFIHWNEGITYVGVQGFRWRSSIANDGTQLNVLSNDFDADGDSLSVDSLIPVQPPYGAVAVVFPPFSTCKVVKDIPTFLGTVDFTYSTSDSLVSTVGSVSVTWTNSAPVAVPDSLSIAESAIVSPVTQYQIDVLANDNDPNPQDKREYWYITSISHVSSNPPLPGGFDFDANVKIDPTLARFITYEQALFWHGEHTFKYTMTDGASTSNIATVTITVGNTPPVAANTIVSLSQAQIKASGYWVDVDLARGPTPFCTDRDMDGLSISVASPMAPNGFLTVLDASGPEKDSYVKYTYNNLGDATDESFTYTCCDVGNLCDDGSIQILIAPNTPPVASPFTTSISYERPTPVVVPIDSVCTDADGDVLSFVLPLTQTQGASHGSFTITDGGATLSFTLGENITTDATAIATFTCSDSLATNQSTASIFISFNAAPLPQDQTVSKSYNEMVNGALNPWVWSDATLCVDDEPSDPIYVASIDNATVTAGVVFWKPEEIKYIFTLNNGDGGSSVFTFKCKDHELTSFTSGTISVAIAANLAPVTTPVSGSVSHTVAAGISFDITKGVSPACTDAEADTLNVVINGDWDPALAASAPTFDSVTGQITYIPKNSQQGESGVDAFTYVCSDQYKSAVGSVTVTITNQAPVAYDESFEVPKRNVVNPGTNTLSVIVNDLDSDGDIIFLVSASVAVDSGGAHVVSVTPNGNQIDVLLVMDYYTHEQGGGVYFVGHEPVIIQYQVSDTATVSNIAYLTVSTPYNPPVAVNDEDSFDQTLGAETFTYAVLSNDYDLDGDAFLISSVAWNPAVPILNRGQLVIVNGSTQIAYTPSSSACGVIDPIFTYTIQTSDGLSSQANFKVTITNCVCREKIDIAIVVDGSGSVRNQDWVEVILFLHGMVNGFDMDSAGMYNQQNEYIGVDIGVVQYSWTGQICESIPILPNDDCLEGVSTYTQRNDDCTISGFRCRRWESRETFTCCTDSSPPDGARTHIALGHNKPQINANLDIMWQRKGGTNTRAGLWEGWQMLLGGRPLAQKLLIVMTDGYANQQFTYNGNSGSDPVPMTNDIRLAGIDVFSVGVGPGYSVDQVRGMAGYDDSKVFTTSQFSEMGTLIESIVAKAC